jgi:hypothetical protein
MLPTTIDAIIAELESIMDTCIRTENRLGYFAALYHKVTCAVRDGIQKGDFDDDPRMERFDVHFANRYIAAWQQLQRGEKPTGSWAITFEAAKKRRHLVLQHLLLGMNAHINLDLGVASAQMADPAGLATVRKDFVAINSILSLLSGDLMNVLRRISPFLSLMGLHASRNNSILVQFSISNARDGAWCFAEDLYEKPDTEFQQLLTARDKAITELGSGLTKSTGLMRITLWLIHLFEWKKPSRIIQEMRDKKPVMIKTGQAAGSKAAAGVQKAALNGQ